jgi:hypothetical protein
MGGVRDYLDQIRGETPVAQGVYEALSAANRDELHAAIERCPDLLTDKGAAMFDVAALFTEMLGEPRVTSAIRQRQAAVQAIREARE